MLLKLGRRAAAPHVTAHYMSSIIWILTTIRANFASHSLRCHKVARIKAVSPVNYMIKRRG